MIFFLFLFVSFHSSLFFSLLSSFICLVVLQLGDADAVVNVQAVRDRLKNFNFFGPLTAKSGLDEFFVSSQVWESLEENVKDLFVHHSASLPTKEQMVAEKVRQKHLNARQGGNMMNNQRQQRERKAWLNQHLQYDRIKAAQIQQQEQEYQIQQEMQRRQRQIQAVVRGQG